MAFRARLGARAMSTHPTVDVGGLLADAPTARRGAALAQLQRYAEAEADYRKAVELEPNNEQLRNDLQMISAKVA